MVVVRKQVLIGGLIIELKRDQQHGHQAKHHKRSVLCQVANRLKGVVVAFFLLNRCDPLLGQLVVTEENHNGKNGQDQNADGQFVAVQRLNFGAVGGDGGVVYQHGKENGARQAADTGADGTPHGQGGAFFLVIGDHGGQRAVRNVDAGVHHTVQNVGDVGKQQVFGRTQIGNDRKHQHRRHRQRNGKPKYIRAEFALLGGFSGVNERAPNGVVDGVPKPSHQNQNHDLGRLNVQHIGVKLVLKCTDQ